MKKPTFVTVTIYSDFVDSLVDCGERLSDEFLKQKSSLFRAVMEAATEEFIEDQFGTWQADYQESLRDAAADAELHEIRERGAA